MKKTLLLVFVTAQAVTILTSCKRESTSVKTGSSDLIGTTPEWMRNEPIVMVGNWDSAPVFRIRKGGYQTWDIEDYPKTHTEEAVIKLKDMGVTMAMIHFFKGFGLEAERDQLEDAKILAAHCKKHGLRVGVYIGSTIGYETFLAEAPEAESWFVPDYLGQPVRYGGTQTFRKKVYFMHPGYRKYIKNVLRIAVTELKADLIHFDNTSGQAAIPVFYHPKAVEDFRSYLRDNYSPAQIKERLGFEDVSYVEPPVFSGSLSLMIDPLFQLWTDFRCQHLVNYYNEMEEYIQGLNPQVAVENNPSGLTGSNSMWNSSIDFPRLLPHTDAFWDESANPDYTHDSILISKIRTYKMAALFNNRVFTYTGDSRLDMAEAMAYNRQCMGMAGGLLTGYELSEPRTGRGFDNPYSEGMARESYQDMKNKASYIRFFNEKFQYFRGVDNIADVAVLHTYASMAYDNNRPYQSTYLVEQALIQAKIPFDIIFDDNLNDLSEYRVLIAADQKCLSDQNIGLITDYVKKGGGLVATEHTSLYTERFARREHFGLRDLFQIDPPVWRGYDVERSDYSVNAKNEQLLNIVPVKNIIGSGRVVYLPMIKPSREKPSGAAMTNTFWKPARNNEEILDLIRWAADDALSLTVKSPDYVTAELTKNADRSKLMLHLINYNFRRDTLVKNIEVSMKIPAGSVPKQVKVFSPDMEELESLLFNISDNRIRFVVPQLYVYDLIVLELN
jgi:hypothetical protein